MKHKMLLATVASILAAVGGAAAVSAGSEPRFRRLGAARQRAPE